MVIVCHKQTRLAAVVFSIWFLFTVEAKETCHDISISVFYDITVVKGPVKYKSEHVVMGNHLNYFCIFSISLIGICFFLFVIQ